MFGWLLFTILIVFVYILLRKRNQHWKTRNVLYIKPYPLVGNMLPFITGQMDLQEWVKNAYNSYNARYFGVYHFLQPVLLIKDLDLIKQVLIRDFNHFVDHKSFFAESNEPVFGVKLSSLKGQKWRDMRATLSPAFTSSKMKAMYVLMAKRATQFVDHFVKEAENEPNKPLIMEINNLCKKFANDVIASFTFGVDCNSIKDEHNEFYQRSKEAIDLHGVRALKFLGLMVCPDLMKFLKVRLFSEDDINYFRSVIMNTIEVREKNNIVCPDMVQLLLEARKGQLTHDNGPLKSSGGKLTNDDVTAQALSFFLAGFDTSATILSFMAYDLALNPEIQQRLQDEIDIAYEECDGNITYEKLIKLEYLDMVICESLRMWPVVAFLDRLCVKPYTIQPVGNEKPLLLKEGDIVNVPLCALHMDPEYFPNPERFDPERFSSENKSKINPSTYMPFGGGLRSCIGNRFAMLSVKTFYFHLLSKFDIVVVEKSQIPLQLSKFNLLPDAKNGLWFGYKLRIK